MFTPLDFFEKMLAHQELRWLLDMGVRGGMLLTVAAVLAFLMRHRSAAVRHLIWTLAMGALLVLPWISTWGPRVYVPILPIATRLPQVSPAQLQINTPSSVLVPQIHAQDAVLLAQSTSHLRETSLPLPDPSDRNRTQWHWILWGWLAGAGILFTHMVAGIFTVQHLVRRSARLEDRQWQELLEQLTTELGLRHSVSLLKSRSKTMPMACGIFWPKVLLPNEIQSWPRHKQRVVLTHELAHVKRRDCLTHCIARLALALQWFNPLAWLALHCMRTEREHACDDLVLNAGSVPEDYADQLLQIASSMRSSVWALGASVSMACSSRLEGRVRAIIDATRNRRSLTRRIVLLSGVLIVLLAGALSVVSLTTRDTPLSERTDTIHVSQERIDELIYILRHYTMPTPKRFDRSLDALRELTRVGSPAVPALLAELKRGGNGFEQSLIFLTLRVIGDVRAVPVLADMIETLNYGGSDRGSDLSFASKANVAFMTEHAWGKSLGYKETDPDFFPMGRPASELRSTLAALTGLDFGHEYTHPRDLDGLEELRTKAAQAYRQWWSKHKDSIDEPPDESNLHSGNQAHVSDPIELVGTRLYGTFIPQGDHVRLGDVMTVSLDAQGPEHQGIDLDTGQIFQRKAKDRQTEQHWKQVNSIDAVALISGLRDQKQYGHLHTTYPEGMFVWTLEDYHWDSIEAALRQDSLVQLGNPHEGFHFNPNYHQHPRTYFFRTAQGTSGILQIAGLDVKTKRVEFKYRLVKTASVGTQAEAEIKQQGGAVGRSVYRSDKGLDVPPMAVSESLNASDEAFIKEVWQSFNRWDNYLESVKDPLSDDPGYPSSQIARTSEQWKRLEQEAHFKSRVRFSLWLTDSCLPACEEHGRILRQRLTARRFDEEGSVLDLQAAKEKSALRLRAMNHIGLFRKVLELTRMHLAGSSRYVELSYYASERLLTDILGAVEHDWELLELAGDADRAQSLTEPILGHYAHVIEQNRQRFRPMLNERHRHLPLYSARVVDSGNRGVPGAVLTFRTQSGDLLGRVLSDAEGRFLWPAVDHREAFAFVAQVRASGYWPRKEVDVVRRVDGTFMDTEICLHRSARLSGILFGPDGKPLAHAPLSMHTYQRYPHTAAMTSNHLRSFSDINGKWTFEAIPPGQILVFYPWMGPTMGEVNAGIWDRWKKPGETYPSAPIKGVCAFLSLTVEDGAVIDELRIDLSRSVCALEGDVTDRQGKPVRGARVSALMELPYGRQSFHDGSAFPPAQTDSTGHYRLAGLPAGLWHIRATDADYKNGGKLIPVQLRPGQAAQRNLTVDLVLPDTGG
jgi:beta-lactamase regulating signal transducer with metallopeptidase domain